MAIPNGTSSGTNFGKSNARNPAANAAQRRIRLSLTAARYMESHYRKSGLRVPMRGFQAKGRRTDCDVFCSALFRRAVLDPFAGMRYNRLACTNIEGANSVSDPQHTFQNNSELLKFRRLSWLDPADGTSQESDTDLTVAGIDPPDVLVDGDGHVGHGFNSSWLGNQSWHLVGS